MKKAKLTIDGKLPVIFLREGKAFIAYSPALDISTAGDTFEDARDKFSELLLLFFQELAESGKFHDALLELGWQQKDNHLKPPALVSQETQEIPVPDVENSPYTVAKV